MKYYIVTNRQILTVAGKETVDTTNNGICSDSLRFAIFDSSNVDTNNYELIPDKVDPTASQPNQSANSGDHPYYFNDAEPVKTGSERFFNELWGDMSADDGGDLLVFFHGFNCDWAGGISNLRDLERLFIAPPNSTIKHMVIFSWPSMASLFRYKSDFADASSSGVTIGRCFQLMCEFFSEAFGIDNKLVPCSRKIHLLCHSMGNHVLEHMMDKIIADGNTYQDTFEEIILAAADADNNLFDNPNAFFYLNNLCRRIHVYSNRNDLVLKFSAKYENPMKRLGTDGPANLNSLPSHVYVIDCTDVVAKQDPQLQDKVVHHWYYKDVAEVSNDIFSVLQGIDDEKIANRTAVTAIKFRLI
jgi:esterase/lipase superfamily enzyme